MNLFFWNRDRYENIENEKLRDHAKLHLESKNKVILARLGSRESFTNGNEEKVIII